MTEFRIPRSTYYCDLCWKQLATENAVINHKNSCAMYNMLRHGDNEYKIHLLNMLNKNLVSHGYTADSIKMETEIIDYLGSPIENMNARRIVVVKNEQPFEIISNSEYEKLKDGPKRQYDIKKRRYDIRQKQLKEDPLKLTKAVLIYSIDEKAVIGMLSHNIEIKNEEVSLNHNVHDTPEWCKEQLPSSLKYLR